MRLAFYAPMKPPHHPVPSGDRTMARAVIAALEAGGAQVDLASDLQTRDGSGDRAMQADLRARAAALLPDLVACGKLAGWRAWISYHSYYKAPDLLGPAVAAALGIAYVQIESTRARKRLDGPWGPFAQAAEQAADAAGLIFYLTRRDATALRAYAPASQRLIHLRPFLARATLPDPATGSAMLAVGMMRAGDKLASYMLIAETLARMPRDDWQLNIAGDGPARAQVTASMAPFGPRVRFLGKLDAAGMAAAYRDADLLFWPGVNEAFGLSYLEAQSHGLAVVAQDRPGVRDVLLPGRYPAPSEGAEGLLRCLNASKPDRAKIRAHVAAHHLLGAGRDTLMQGLAAVGVR